MSTGVNATASVMTGSTKDCGPSMSIAGNHASRTEKTSTSTTASQKLGVERAIET